MLKTTGWILALSLSFGFSTQAQELWEHRLEIFEKELEDFIDQSHSFREDAFRLSPQQQEERIEGLMQVASRISGIYFDSLHLDEKEQFDQTLKSSLNKAADLRIFFHLIGNQFVSDAQSLIDQQHVRERRFVMWSTIGGGLLGFAGGSALIYFRSLGGDRLVGKVVTLALLTGAGTGVGYFGSKALKGILIPVDPDVLTARDFLNKYPDGEDFINSISPFEWDLTDRMSELDGAYNEIF